MSAVIHERAWCNCMLVVDLGCILVVNQTVYSSVSSGTATLRLRRGCSPMIVIPPEASRHFSERWSIFDARSTEKEQIDPVKAAKRETISVRSQVTMIEEHELRKMTKFKYVNKVCQANCFWWVRSCSPKSVKATKSQGRARWIHRLVPQNVQLFSRFFYCGPGKIYI